MSETDPKKITALVVDDNQDDNLALRCTLEIQGFSVLSALSAEQAVDVISNNKIDVIALDWILPRITGIELLKRLQGNPQWKSIPVIMVTARKDSCYLAESLSEGACDHIRKPVDRVELVARIHAALRGQEARNRLEQSNQELLRLVDIKDDFVLKIYHDIRNPLSSIIGFSEFLLEGKWGELNDKQVKMVENIRKSAKDYVMLAENMLEMVRLNSGRVVLRLRKADLAGIAQECWEGVKPVADRKNIDLVLSGAKEEVPVMVDGARITQVANNLIGNALKFTPRGGRVEVAVFRESGGGVLRVSDNGPGIPEEDIEKLFNQFSQTKTAPTAGESGFGLGLSIVKSIVDMHNGKVWVKSRYGEGAEFYVSLPMAEMRAQN